MPKPKPGVGERHGSPSVRVSVERASGDLSRLHRMTWDVGWRWSLWARLALQTRPCIAPASDPSPVEGWGVWCPLVVTVSRDPGAQHRRSWTVPERRFIWFTYHRPWIVCRRVVVVLTDRPAAARLLGRGEHLPRLL